MNTMKVGMIVKAKWYTAGVGGKTGVVVRVWNDVDGNACVCVDHGNMIQENFAGNYEIA